MKDQTRLANLQKLCDDTLITRKGMIESLGMAILELSDVISGVIGAGGKIMSAGNGGSMTVAMHFTSELVVRLSSQRNRRALPAVSLGINPAVSSAASNDFGWENSLAREVEALGRKGDILLLLSTSGKAQNLVKAAQIAKDLGILTAGLLGGGGISSRLQKVVDRTIVVPHPSPQRVHEEHLFIIHLLSEEVERDLFV